MADHFLADFCQRARRKLPPTHAAARKRLLEHPWPGNVRELRNLMERLAYLSTEDRIEAEDLAFILSPRGQAPLVADLSQPLAEATDRFQIEYIRRLIEQCRRQHEPGRRPAWACTARTSIARCGNWGWKRVISRHLSRGRNPTERGLLGVPRQRFARHLQCRPALAQSADIRKILGLANIRKRDVRVTAPLAQLVRASDS